jgi:hypothetical protein
MKTYNVILTGQQKHIKGNVFENKNEFQVNQIIDKYISDNYDRPKFNGDSFELNNDLYIEIKEVSND